jgi:hypothetical protein
MGIDTTVRHRSKIRDIVGFTQIVCAEPIDKENAGLAQICRALRPDQNRIERGMASSNSERHQALQLEALQLV